MEKNFCFVVCFRIFNDVSDCHSSSYPVRVFLSYEAAYQFLMEQKSNKHLYYSLFKVILDETSSDKI